MPIPNRLAEEHSDSPRMRDDRSFPAAVVRPLDDGGKDRQVVLQRQQADPRLELADRTVRRPGAFGKQDDVGALRHVPAAVRDSPPVEPIPVHRDRVGQQKGDRSLQRMLEEVVLRAQAADAVDSAERKRGEQHGRIEVAGMIGHDQMPSQSPQLGVVVRAITVEPPQVSPQQDVDRHSHRPGDEPILDEVERRRRSTVAPVHHPHVL
jgi:hypothetical protein